MQIQENTNEVELRSNSVLYGSSLRKDFWIALKLISRFLMSRIATVDNWKCSPLQKKGKMDFNQRSKTYLIFQQKSNLPKCNLAYFGEIVKSPMGQKRSDVCKYFSYLFLQDTTREWNWFSPKSLLFCDGCLPINGG